ncbi:MAG: flagellar motor protein MotD [Methylicorpusculum sp.]|nr:flagellar motor protein MotD [Methylicorpusculum sp.]MDO8937848.1 flagellar motor protein MotD [Methylicorpusculum sp.]MDO9242112.1 flagellar motor protein MotD [Methylicorpusculum sp.]MDP2202565.1 flagellar motor protein MotD [Methylicorpusculum sp.]
MMRRKRKELLESDNHDRWLVSYADFITLLFAFFVVMYSISSVNEGKYKTLSDSLEGAFSSKSSDRNIAKYEGMPYKIIQPIQVGDTPMTIQPIELDQPTLEEVEKKHELSEEILKERRNLIEAAEQFKEVLAPFIEEELVNVKKNDFWIELEMNSELLFASGEAALSPKAIPILQKVSEIVRLMPNSINVEGHTDNRPISTLQFPSNWELSSARASSVVREFEREGINSDRLSAIGYGEFHPIADNTNDDGRFQNRRVSIVLMSHAFARYGANDQERARLLNIAQPETTEGVEPPKTQKNR